MAPMIAKVLAAKLAGDEGEPTKEDEKHEKMMAKEAMASSMIDAFKNGEAARLSETLGNFVQLCMEDYDDDNSHDDEKGY